MKISSLLLVALFLPVAGCFAQKDTCRIGIYVNSLYDFNMEDKSFVSDFWTWQIYKNDSLNFENTVEVPNSKSAEFTHYTHEKKGILNWVTQKCNARVMCEWDVTKFPFDKQRLIIEIEDSKYDANQLIYIADTLNSLIDTAFNSKEWCIEHFSIKSQAHTYETTYGDPGLSGKSSYPRVVAIIDIKRNNSWLTLTKMLTGAYVAFLISCLVFFVSSENQDSRFGLCVGGLFAAIGNKYIVESTVSSSSTTTLMDNVHTLTFTFILLIVGIIIVSLNLFESGDERKKKISLILDKWAFFSVITLYIVINFFLIHLALR
jgi:Neurotransmitter-gated ion-channel ligand binding domain